VLGTPLALPPVHQPGVKVPSLAPLHKAGLARIADAPHFLVVNPRIPARWVPELIAYATVNPGKVTLASGQ
jgi:hypothetical protein